jgi:D-ribose pyranose/furanose isomerase RbsD
MWGQLVLVLQVLRVLIQQFRVQRVLLGSKAQLVRQDILEQIQQSQDPLE